MPEDLMAEQATGAATPPVRTIAELPGPKGIPILGNARQIEPQQFHRTLEKWARQYDGPYKFRVARRTFVVVSDRDVIANILRDRPVVFRRSSRTARMLEEAGTRGLFTAEGEEWRRQRKLGMRALTPEVVHRYFPNLIMMTERLLARWNAALAAGREVDVLRDLKAYTLDVTIGLAMGQDINTLEHEDNPLQRDIEFLFSMVARRLTSPFAYWRLFKRKVDRDADAAHQRIHAAVTGFIAQARARLDHDPSLRTRPSNMLEALVAARDEPDSGFSDAEVIGNAITMVFAGEDTTSNTIAWLLHLLSQNPQADTAAGDEALRLMGADTVVRELRLLDSFTYTDAATREAMRLKPVAPFMAAEPNVDTVVDGIAMPAGTIVFLMLRYAADRASEFEQPEQFDPRRWLTAGGVEAASDPGRKMFPFGGGPRFCPGRYLAMAEIKMVMAMILRNFTLSAKPGAPAVEERFTFTMTPSALPLLLHPRA
jgi:cytochrome P450